MLGLRPASGRRRYKVKPSAIRWVQTWYHYMDGLVQGCNISIANALQMLQSCTKLLIYINEIVFTLQHFHIFVYNACHIHDAQTCEKSRV